MKIKYNGHANFEIDFNGTKILIDPWFTGNPQAQMQASEARADYVFVTHSHSDHIGDAVEIALNNDAPIVAVDELALVLEARFNVKIIPANCGGYIKFPNFEAKLVPARHSNVLMLNGERIFAGDAVGFVFRAEGKELYHAGDTSLTTEMELINPDIAILPVGSHYTMSLEDLPKAQEMLRAKTIIPMHFNTFDAITVTEQELTAAGTHLDADFRVVQVGETLDF
ncbi:MAG: metal-dependent hydrolase [Lactobacillales bacterium]|jgi:L-ascorbate metabolism protein UlaG (beta-lactamase superfamily)|nr:metal-dependent hydrolase [Lactobacillales bacterium]